MDSGSCFRTLGLQSEPGFAHNDDILGQPGSEMLVNMNFAGTSITSVFVPATNAGWKRRVYFQCL